jgi:hypothetical protein
VIGLSAGRPHASCGRRSSLAIGRRRRSRSPTRPSRRWRSSRGSSSTTRPTARPSSGRIRPCWG